MKNANPMLREAICSIVIPVYNEEESIEEALLHLSKQLVMKSNLPFNKNTFEIIIVDNNSTDSTLNKINQFKLKVPEINIVVTSEKKQGVAWARKNGMDLAVERSKKRDEIFNLAQPFYLFSTDADCCVDSYWIDAQINALQSTGGALSVCHYYYPMKHFERRPNLSRVMNLILQARDRVMRLFGGFPDGKGFAVLRETYEKINGIEIFYQLSQGQFVCHLSDDWDFGIKVRASGEEIIYCHEAKVHTNPRRVDHAMDEMIQGTAYGINGIITMRDIRNKRNDTELDLDLSEAGLLFDYSIKDFTTKHIILPILLSPSLLKKQAIREFLSEELCQKLSNRILQIKDEMHIKNFIPIHSYKTPCFRLYFEFRDDLFARMRECVDSEIGYPPVLPECLSAILKDEPNNFNSYVYYYCEDRESGEAHNYFGNGGVF